LRFVARRANFTARRRSYRRRIANEFAVEGLGEFERMVALDRAFHLVDGRPAFGPRNSAVSGGVPGSAPSVSLVDQRFSGRAMELRRRQSGSLQTRTSNCSFDEFASHFRVHGETALRHKQRRIWSRRQLAGRVNGGVDRSDRFDGQPNGTFAGPAAPGDDPIGM
jgi:hypothetical protein